MAFDPPVKVDPPVVLETPVAGEPPVVAVPPVPVATSLAAVPPAPRILAESMLDEQADDAKTAKRHSNSDAGDRIRS